MYVAIDIQHQYTASFVSRVCLEYKCIHQRQDDELIITQLHFQACKHAHKQKVCSKVS